MSNNYGPRSVWCLKFMGSPQEIHKKMMEDDTTPIGIMEFPPVDKKSTRRHWTYVTNGMAKYPFLNRSGFAY